MKVKPMVHLVSAVLMVLTLGACGAKSPEPASGGNSSSSAANEPVKLRIYWDGPQARHDATLKVLDLYTKKNPNVTFQPEYTTWASYWDKLGVQFSSNNAPDIIQMDTQFISDYANRKLLADLDDVNVSDISKALLDGGKLNGKLYGVPLGGNAFGFVYDKVAFEKYGITPPKDDWTYDDFMKLLKEAKEKVGKDKYVYSMSSDASFNQYQSYQFSKGKGNLYTDDGKFNIDRDTWIEWGNKLAEMRKQGYIPPADIAVGDKPQDPNADLLVKGTILMRSIYASVASAQDSLKPGAYAFLPTPRDKDSGSWIKATRFWSVNAKSKNIQEAKKFVDWFVNDPEAAQILGTTRGMPPSNKILEKLKPNFTTGDKLGAELVEKVSKNAHPFVGEPVGWSNFNIKDFTPIYEAMTFGKMTPEQAYDELVKSGKQYENAGK